MRVTNPLKHICGAHGKTRQAPCQHPAGYKTSHLGEGRCFLHGGNNVVKHGRYSTITHPGIKAALEAQENEAEDVMDLRPEIRLIRALCSNFVAQYDQQTALLQAWNRDPNCPKPTWIPDLHDAGRLAEKVARIADSVHKITSEGSISLDSYRRLMGAMGEAVARQVNKMMGLSDEDKAALTKAIEDDWLSMAVR